MWFEGTVALPYGTVPFTGTVRRFCIVPERNGTVQYRQFCLYIVGNILRNSDTTKIGAKRRVQKRCDYDGAARLVKSYSPKPCTFF